MKWSSVRHWVKVTVCASRRLVRCEASFETERSRARFTSAMKALSCARSENRKKSAAWYRGDMGRYREM